MNLSDFTAQLFSSPLYILSVLVACVFASEWLLKFKFLKGLGAALIVILLTMIVANLGLLPKGSNGVYDGIFGYIAPAAIFLLMLDVNLGELRKVGLPMLLLFLAGTIGTTIGVVVAYQIIPDTPIFSGDYSALAGMIAGTYTGGALNFNAVALHFNVMENGLLYTSAIAVDNLFTAVWMFVTLLIPRIMLGKKYQKVTIEEKTKRAASPNLKQLSLLILLTIGAIWISDEAATWFASHNLQIPSILIITIIALIFAQFKSISIIPGNQLYGTWLVYLFLAVIGAFCDLSAFAEAGKLALIILGFVIITVVIHGVVMWFAQRFIPCDWEEVAIASQANIGGSTTAMALAQTFNRPELVLPAIIIGTVGNATGTFIGFLIAFNI